MNQKSYQSYIVLSVSGIIVACGWYALFMNKGGTTKPTGGSSASTSSPVQNPGTSAPSVPIASIAAPSPVAPGTVADTGASVSKTPTLKWKEVKGAEGYALYVAKEPYGAADIVYSMTGLTGSTHVLPAGYLSDGTKYRWQLSSFQGGAEGAKGDSLYFKTPPPPPPPPRPEDRVWPVAPAGDHLSFQAIKANSLLAKVNAAPGPVLLLITDRVRPLEGEVIATLLDERRVVFQGSKYTCVRFDQGDSSGLPKELRTMDGYDKYVKNNYPAAVLCYKSPSMTSVKILDLVVGRLELGLREGETLNTFKQRQDFDIIARRICSRLEQH